MSQIHNQFLKLQFGQIKADISDTYKEYYILLTDIAEQIIQMMTFSKSRIIGSITWERDLSDL